MATLSAAAPRFVAARMIGIGIVGFAVQGHALADSIYDVTINTTSLATTDGTLAFDFVAGGGSQSNTVSISDFVSNGTLGASGPNSGSVSGALPGTITLNNSSFFNEVLQGITLGTNIAFTLDATSNAPTGSSLPDTFSFFVLDPAATTSLLTTTDPTGANSLFSLQIDGSSGGILGNYNSSPAVSAIIVPGSAKPPPVPEPGTMALATAGLLLMLMFSRRRMFIRRPRTR
jgi:hypothetical protein